MKIAVVGAPGTGKTSLVTALRLALQLDTSRAAATCSVCESAALEQPGDYDLVLLMGLDLPQQAHANGISKAPPTAQCDAQLRQLLDKHAMGYTVVYGSGQARTDCAMQAIDFHRSRTAARPSPAATAWHWNCETCSDAACEHRLFSALVKKSSDSVRQ